MKKNVKGVMLITLFQISGGADSFNYAIKINAKEKNTSFSFNRQIIFDDLSDIAIIYMKLNKQQNCGTFLN